MGYHVKTAVSEDVMHEDAGLIDDATLHWEPVEMYTVVLV